METVILVPTRHGSKSYQSFLSTISCRANDEQRALASRIICIGLTHVPLNLFGPHVLEVFVIVCIDLLCTEKGNNQGSELINIE